ncbi:MAG: RNA methyltransferase [bacterium]
MILTNKNSIVEGLKSGSVRSVLVREGARRDAKVLTIIELCGRMNVPLRIGGAGSRRQSAGEGGPAVTAERRVFEYAGADEVYEGAARGGLRAAVALDHVQDPGNLGALIRLCAAAGVSGLVIERRGCCGVTDAAADTSSGGIERVKIARAANLAGSLSKAKEKGLWVVGADESAERDCWSFDFAFPLVLVMGGEGMGLSRPVKKVCDDLVRVPADPAFPTLNVAVAAGVLVFELLRRRAAGG